MRRDSDPTQRLVSEARAGRREAFEELFGQHREELERALRRRVPRELERRVDVSGVVQDALLDAYRALDGFEYRGQGSFRSWLRRISENRLKMVLARHLGRRKRDAARDEVLHSGELAPSSDATSPSSAAGRRERGVLVRAALVELSPDHREVLRLVKLEGGSIADAAAAMQRSENATKKLLARALTELARRLPPGAQA